MKTNSAIPGHRMIPTLPFSGMATTVLSITHAALAADQVFFDSDFHRNDFLDNLTGVLRDFPDYHEIKSVAAIAAKSERLPLGLDLRRFDLYRPEWKTENERPLLLWNHRWEYDKNPDHFFKGLFFLQDQGVDFDLAVLGESYQKQPPIFAEARQRLNPQIVHWGG